LFAASNTEEREDRRDATFVLTGVRLIEQTARATPLRRHVFDGSNAGGPGTDVGRRRRALRSGHHASGHHAVGYRDADQEEIPAVDRVEAARWAWLRAGFRL
jgi:hypothetical protein